MLWAESFRPQTLSEVIGQDHIVKRLQFMVDVLHRDGGDANFPHLMFAGPAGTGKTSLAMALAKTMFGSDWKANWIEMNASDERSISVVRTKVKEFAQRGVMGNYLANGESRPIPFNIIFLDECDNLTPDAQSSLRRIMEKYSKQTRFILSCNYPHKIIDPIKDRCAFSDTRFRPISPKSIYGALVEMAGREELEITDEALERISEVCRGSMRKATNILFATTRVPTEATLEDVEDVVSEMTPKSRTRLLKLAFDAAKADTDEAYRKITMRLDKQVETLAEQGFSGIDILESVFRAVSDDKRMPLTLQRTIFASIGDALYHATVAQDDILVVKAWLRRLAL